MEEIEDMEDMEYFLDSVDGYDFNIIERDGKRIVIDSKCRFVDIFDNLGQEIIDSLTESVSKALVCRGVSKRMVKQFLFGDSVNKYEFDKSIELGRNVLEFVQRMGCFEIVEKYDCF